MIKRRFLFICRPFTRSCKKSRASFHLICKVTVSCLLKLDSLSSANTPAEVVLAHVYNTELAINQIALSRLPIVHNYPDFEQLSYLCACTKSIKTWFEVFFSVSPIFYIGFPFSIFAQLRHCLVTLHRLSTLDDPAWDRKGLRKIINLLPILDQVINNLEQVAAAAGLDNTASAEGDVFSRTAKLLRSIRPIWESRLGPDDDDATTALPPPQNSLDMSLFEPLPVDFIDEWLTDFVLPPNY